MQRAAPAWARVYATFALLLALAPAVVIILGALGTKFGLWSWKAGFVAVLVNGPAPGLGWAPALAMAAIVVALIGLIVSIRMGLWRQALAALLIGLATMGAFVFVGGQARKAPPIHDVSTNWNEPLIFSEAVMQRRGAEANPVVADPRIAEINEKTCPEARPVLLQMPVEEAYARTRAALTEQGLEIVTDDPATGRLEAVASSFWYGFKDDLVARIAPEGSGARVDMRSVSRVGVSDLGQNCKRIAALAGAIWKG